MRWDDVPGAVDRLLQLADDWDGQGAPTPHPLAVVRLAMSLGEMRGHGRRPPDRVTPNLEAGGDAEWFDDDLYTVVRATETGTEYHEVSR